MMSSNLQGQDKSPWSDMMSNPSTSFLALSQEVISEAVAWRHHLHKHPELAYQERQTADFIATQLSRFGLSVHRGLGGTGVVGTLTRGTSRRTIGIRADMDALPIHEKNSLPHASTHAGVMHACGHDGHVAIALAAARVCASLPGLDGTVHFIFQPAEEGEGGARRMIEDGLFKLFPCDAIYALHNWPALPVGTCAVRDGPMLAASAVFEVVISGQGCHGAMPHQGVDPIIAASHLVCALQSIASRNVDPLAAAIVSVTQFHSGDAWSVIPESCMLRGTTRWFKDEVGEVIERRMKQLVQSTADAFNCKAELRYRNCYPATINDSAAVQVVKTVIGNASLDLRLVETDPTMGSEDFAEMLRVVPGCYVWLGGARSAADHGLHSCHYDFNDDALPLGTRLWASLVQESLRVA